MKLSSTIIILQVISPMWWDFLRSSEGDTPSDKSYKEVYNRYLNHFSKKYESEQEIEEHFDKFREKLSAIIGEKDPNNYINFDAAFLGEKIPIRLDGHSLTESFDSDDKESIYLPLPRAEANLPPLEEAHLNLEPTGFPLLQENQLSLEENNFSFWEMNVPGGDSHVEEKYKTLKLYFIEPEAQALIAEITREELDPYEQIIKWKSMTEDQKHDLKQADRSLHSKMRLLEKMFPVVSDSLSEVEVSKSPGRLLRYSHMLEDIFEDLGQHFLIPKSINYRQKYLGHVLQQGSKCSACYAYGAINLLESQTFLTPGIGEYYRDKLALSPQDAVNCSPTGCSPGRVIDVLLLSATKGLQPRANKELVQEARTCEKSLYVKRWKFHFDLIPGGEARIFNIVKLLEFGVVSVDVIIPRDYAIKNSRYILTEAMCDESASTGQYGLGHNIMITGYHKGSKNDREDVSYFRARNTWGTKWGKDGFFAIEIPKFNMDWMPCAMRVSKIHRLNVLGLKLI